MSDHTHSTSTAKVQPWNDPKIRSMVFQAMAAVFVIYVFWAMFDNTLMNMERRGITTGFDFLNNTAGFDILMTLIDYDATYTYGRTFVVGLLNTVLVATLGIFIATILGFLIGVARLSSNWLIAKIATVYIETLRNIPLLLQMFFWYFAVLQVLPLPRQSLELSENIFLNNRGLFAPAPIFQDGFSAVVIAFLVAVVGVIALVRWAKKRRDATGQPFATVRYSLAILFVIPVLTYYAVGAPMTIEDPVLKGFNFQGGTRIIPELMALLWALSFYTAAFIAEIVRSGIMAVNSGQTEAAKALGVRSSVTLRLVIIPQALRVIIPPLTSQYLNLAKNSSLATAIGYPDLVSVFMGTTLNQTGQAVEIVAMTMAVYLTMSLVISYLMNVYNARMALTER